MQTDMMRKMNHNLTRIADELDTLNNILTEMYYLYGEIHGVDFSKEIKDGRYDSVPRSE